VPPNARFFGLLSASPGPDIALPTAAILPVADRAVTFARLDELTGLAAGQKHRVLFRRVSNLYRDDAKVARGALSVVPNAGRPHWRSVEYAGVV
jgi:hypothetical protein